MSVQPIISAVDRLVAFYTDIQPSLTEILQANDPELAEVVENHLSDENLILEAYEKAIKDSGFRVARDLAGNFVLSRLVDEEYLPVEGKPLIEFAKSWAVNVDSLSNDYASPTQVSA